MAKPKVSAVSAKPGAGDLSRSKRRASQTKHRKSSDTGTKRKILNKVEVLHQSKDYILHLERVLQNLIDKKKTTKKECENFDNAVARTIKNFDTMDAFRAHFRARFEPRNEMSAYFDESRAVNIEKGMPARSSQFSEDLGFVSGEGSSQERCSTGCGLQNSQETNPLLGKLVRPYPLRSPLPRNYPYYGIYANHPYFTASHVLYYVPAIGFHAPYYIPCQSNAQESQSAKKQDTPSSSPSIVPRNKLKEKVTKVSTAAEPSLEATVSSTTSVPRLELRYTYSKPDGKMSAPKICARGQCGNSDSHPTLVVVKKSAGECDEDTGEYYSCLLANSR